MRLDFFTECFFLPVLELAAFVVVFEVMVGCPFLDSRAAGRGRGLVRREIARFVVNRLAPAGVSFSRLSRPPIGPFGVRRQLARYRVTRDALAGDWSKV